MVDRSTLAEALEQFDDTSSVAIIRNLYNPAYVDVLAAAARRVLEPDYEAAKRALEDVRYPSRAYTGNQAARHIVDAALGIGASNDE